VKLELARGRTRVARYLKKHFLTKSPARRTLDLLTSTNVDKGLGPIRVLDIGYGSGLHWTNLESDFPENVEITALDLASGENLGPAARFVRGRVPECLVEFPDASFDCVVAFDLIEHLEKHDGYRLIYEMERISSQLSVIFTPNGHVWQPPAPSNPFQAHISGWTPSEMKSLGWTEIFGTTGAKFLYGPLAIPKALKSGFPAQVLRHLIDRVITLSPALSFSFLAIQRRSRLAVSSKNLDEWRTG
jgi:hypothetical protein